MVSQSRTQTVATQDTYGRFQVGGFSFERDNYFATIRYPGGQHILPIDAFLKAIQRDLGWNFFYGMVKFDDLFGTFNHYGTVEIFAGKYTEAYTRAGLAYAEEVPAEELSATWTALLEDWCPPDFDPWAAPRETGSAIGPKRGGPATHTRRQRIVTTRLITELRREPDYPINSAFADVPRPDGELHIAPGHESKFGLVNLFDYLARSDVTWNPSVVSVQEHSLFCPTTEEYILPIRHGNDRVEWFVQLTGEITWDICDRDTGAPRAHLTMRPGDVAAMPSDISHQGFAPERSMLLVWENADPELPRQIASGEALGNPAEMVRQ